MRGVLWTQRDDACPHSRGAMTALNQIQQTDRCLRPSLAPAHVSLCCPSRVTTWLGVWLWQHGVNTNGKGATMVEAQSVAYAIQQAGIPTANIGKYLNDVWGWQLGFDRWLVPKSNQPDAFNCNLNSNGATVSLPGDVHLTDYLAEKVVEWLDTDPEVQSSGRFFLHFAPMSGHKPYQPPVRYQDWQPSTWPYRPASWKVVDASQPAWLHALPTVAGSGDQDRLGSYRSLRAYDDAVALIRDALIAKGWWDEVAWFDFTDNGSQFYEHNWGSAVKRTCYREAIDSQLRVRHPSLPADGADTDILVGSVDVPATTYDLLDVQPALTQSGLSLRPLLEGGDITALANRPGLPIACTDPNQKPPPWEGWIDRDGWTYCRLSTGEEELYPPGDQIVSLHDHPDHQQRKAQMIADLNAAKA